MYGHGNKFSQVIVFIKSQTHCWIVSAGTRVAAHHSKNKITDQGRCDSITSQDLRLAEVSLAHKLGYITAVRVSQLDIVVETGRTFFSYISTSAAIGFVLC